MNTANHCKTLRRVTKAELVNAVHDLFLQLRAADSGKLSDCINNKPALFHGRHILKKAGHLGFTD